jgi:hypothetical protein
VDGLRTNVFHLPIRGSGDGGIHSTIGDIHQLWAAFRNGEIVSAETVSTMTTPRTAIAQPDHSYGLGFWLKPATGAVVLHGYDAGVSCTSIDQPATEITHTDIANSSQGAGPMTRLTEASLHT